MMTQEGDVLWEPSEELKRQSNMTAFMEWLKSRHGYEFSDYEALWQWSVDDIERFWQCLWDYFELKSSTPFERVLGTREMPGATWFPGARINYAKQILSNADSNGIAFKYLSELRSLGQVSWQELSDMSARVGHNLRELGVQPGDRVVSFMPNISETLIAFLGAASIGATWSNCAPEFGIKSALDRFGQVDPRILFTVDGYRYAGKDFDKRADVSELIRGLPSLQHVISVSYLFAD